MPYPEQSIARRLVEEDSQALGQVIRWISVVVASPRFWPVRREWTDLSQEILARVIESLRNGRYDSSRDFRAYVQGIARFACLQAIGKQVALARSPIPEGRAHRAPADPEKIVIDLQLARRVLDLASEECRELFHKYYFGGENYESIATSLGVPVGTVKSRLFRCLERAFEALGSKPLGAPGSGRE